VLIQAQPDERAAEAGFAITAVAAAAAAAVVPGITPSPAAVLI
jgi:hypothetical protein